MGFGCCILGHKGLGVDFLPGAPASGHSELKWSGNPMKAQNLSILQCLLLCRKPFPRPPGFASFLGAGGRLGFWALDLGFCV